MARHKRPSTFLYISWRQDTRHWVALSHLLQDLYEESYLDLSGLLKEGIQSSCSLGFAKDFKPLLNCTELILEVLVKGCGGHLLECSFVLIDIRNPLLSNSVGSIPLIVLLACCLVRLSVKVG